FRVLRPRSRFPSTWAFGQSLAYRELSPLGTNARRGLDCLEDLHVPGAAAQVPFERVRDLGTRGIGVLIQERPRRHDEPGRAVATLDRAVFDEGPLHGIEAIVGGQTFDPGHGSALQ